MGKISDAFKKAEKSTLPLDEQSPEDETVSKRADHPPLDLNSYKPQAVVAPALKTPADARQGPPPSLRQTPTPEERRPQAVAPRPRPLDAQHADPNLIVYTQPDSFEAEQFRMLRTNILFPETGKATRSIAVASTSPAEGKSFVAANLAISIAQNIDKYVLLIDCDMRSPSIHQLFGCGPVAGLSNYLLHGQPLQSLIQKTFIERLSILPGGPEPPNPAELLSSGRMTDLLGEVTQRYSDRFIIIDTPPIQLTSEAQAMVKFVDGVLLVIRFGRTSRSTVTKVAQSIEKDKLLGVVGNFADRGKIYKNYAGKYAGYYGRSPKTNPKSVLTAK